MWNKMNTKQKGLMKGVIKIGVIFSIVFIAAIASFYVLPALADATVTATVTNATVNTRVNVTVLNFTITASGNSSLANISINVTGSGFTGLAASNIVCPNATDAGQGTPWNASVVDQDLATCFRNHTTQNLTGTIRVAIKNLLSGVAGRTANFTINVTDDIDRTNITTVSVTVKLLEANATVNVTSVNTGARRDYNFTIINNGTDTIDRINISYATSYPDPDALSSVLCPTTTSLWNRSVDNSTNNIVCTIADPPNDEGIAAGITKTISVENWAAPNDGRVKIFNVNMRGLSGGNFTVVSSRPSTSVFGNLSITGISRAANVNQTGTLNITMITFDFNATGEAMNISEIIVTRNGTVTDADIVSVSLFNSTLPFEDGNVDPLATNISPTNGRYNFSGLSLRLNVSQSIHVVVNLSSSATGGRTMNFSIEGAGDVATVGTHSGQAITETFASQRSGNTTIYGTLSVNGTNRLNLTTNLGANTTTFISYNFTAIGEAMNISEIILLINGTSISSADVQSISIYNSTDPSTTIVDGSQTLIRTNATVTSAVGNLTYNFSGLNLSIPTGATGQIILIAMNISGTGTGGHSVNMTISGNGNIVTVSSASGQNIAETLTNANSTTTKLFGNLTIVGGSRVASTTQIGSKNVTIITFNFTAAGEQMNITGINVTLNGTITVDDIDRIGVYNGTGGYDLIQWNISGPVAGAGNTLRYNFSNIVVNVPSGTTNTLLVIINLTDTAKGGRIFNASIEGPADVITTGGGSASAIVEHFVSQRSSSSTIYGNLSVTGTNIAPSAADVGQIGVGLLRLTLNATGERINVTSINVTSNSTRNQDILSVRLFNDTGGATLGTYERGVDLPIAGASGAFTGSSVILTPTVPFQVENATLVYVYVVVDVNTSATTGAGRLALSIQSAGGISVVGNESLVSLTPQLITGDPGGSSSIRNLTATSTVIVTGTALTRVEAGKKSNFTFTVNNTGTGSLVDSIDEIRINFLDAGFTLSGNATCPTISSIAWNRTILLANTIVCNVTDAGGRLAADTNTTILVQNFTAGQTAGLQPFNITVRGAVGGLFNITSSRPTVTVYGNISFNGTNRVNTTIAINTTQFNGTGVTLISYNVTASGEAMNISEIIVELNGTSISSADVQSVSLFNSTDRSTTIANGSQTLIRTNASVTSTPTSLRYNFSGLNLSVPTGTTGQILLVTVNVSAGATGGHTINATIRGDADIVTVGAITNVDISENQTNMNSSSTTIFGNLTVVGTSRVASTTGIGTGNVTVISFNFTATGEAMNITGINITFNGTQTTADIARVGLYNSSGAAAGLLDGSGVNYDLIQWNISAPVNGRYNFSNIGFNVSAGSTNVLLVVINVTSGATGGNTINASIEGAADVITTGGGSAQTIVEHVASQRSSSSSFSGTLSITGTSRVASWTRLGSTNVTVISFNFSSTGEQTNISEIIITRNGTVTNADIVSVALYNSTQANAQTFNETLNIDPLAVNTSAPVNGRYNFSGLSFKVPSSQIVLVVFNISSGATAGRTFNASIEGIADIVAIGSATGATINETFVTQRSGTSTLVALNVSANTVAPGTISANQTSTAMLNITVVAAGESINITSFNFTLTGNGTAGNISDVRLYRDESTAPGRFDGSDTFLSRASVIGTSIQLNLTPQMYNVSVPIGSVVFFVTYNISGGARSGATVSAQLTPSAIAAVGNESGLAITVTGNSVASANSTIQSEAALTFGTITSTYRWITNKTTTVNSTTITIPVTNDAISTANLTSVLITFMNTTGDNLSTNFTIVRADSVTSIAGGVATTLNFTVNATTGSQLLGLANASVRIIYNDSITLAQVTAGPIETNSTALFGLDGTLPVSQIGTPSNAATVNSTFDINFTLNDTGSGVNTTTLKFYINSAPRNATCNSSGLNFTCNFSFSSGDSVYTYGSNVAYINVSDNATNAATRTEINFTVINGGSGNYTYPTTGTFPVGWNVLIMAPQNVMESIGKNATNTGDFNFTSLMSSLGNAWTHMYYNMNGTSTGWVLATRTDYAGSTLKYLNNSNSQNYFVNITTAGLVFKL